MSILCITVIIILIPERCQSWGILSLKLVSYKNPDSKLFNGKCCDTLVWCTANSCENYFKFCVTSLGSSKPCNLGSSNTKVLGDDDFRFPRIGGSLGTNLINPLTYNFSYWQGSTVVVEVWDDDSGHIVGASHDFVDKYTLTLDKGRVMYPDVKPSKEKTEKLCGKRSCMIVTVTLYCGPNFLVPDCRSYCASRNDSLGHYRCNYVSGRKLCLEGWYDPLTNCVKKRKYCVPRNDSTGYYSCDPTSGEKMCLNGWTGENCTQICYVSSCQQSKNYSSEGSSIATAKTITISTTHTASFWTNAKAGAASSQSSCTILHKVTRSSSLVSPRKTSESQKNTPFQTIVYASFDLHSSQKSKVLLSSMLSTLKPPSLSSLYSLASSSLSSLWSSSSSSSSPPSLSSSSSSSSSSSLLSSSALTSSLSSLQLLPSPSFLTTPLLSSSSSSSSSSSQLLSSSSPSALRSSLLSLKISPYFQSSEHVTVSFGGPSVAPSPTNEYQKDGIEIEISDSNNWTMGKMENVRRELVKKVNEFCHDYPLTCLTTSNTFVNRTVFNTSHIMAKITSSSNGKVWLRVKVKFPVIVESLPSGAGYLPSDVLKEIVLKNKASLEKNLEARIVAVKELAWNQPITPVIQPSVTMTTNITAIPGVPATIHRYIKPNFLPYLLVALSVTAVLIIGFVIFRRSQLRKLRILPQSLSNNTEEEVTALRSLKSSETDNNNSYTTVDYQDFTLSGDEPAYEPQK